MHSYFTILLFGCASDKNSIIKRKLYNYLPNIVFAPRKVDVKRYYFCVYTFVFTSYYNKNAHFYNDFIRY
jgi:hypothetical protein